MKKVLESKNLQQGYTLLEVLVATGIIGILLVVSSAIFINTIRSTNKANILTEARENSALVADTLKRDVRKVSSEAGSVSVSADGLTLTLVTIEGARNWVCVAESSGNNGYITRNGKTLTNKDPFTGVSWSNPNPQKSCYFSIFGSGENILVNFFYTLTEGASAHTAGQDLGVILEQEVSVSTRGF